MKTKLLTMIIFIFFFYSLNNYAQVGTNYAGSFDGVDSYIAVPNDAELNPTSAITIEAWVNPTSLINWPTIVGKAWETNYWFGFVGNVLRFYPLGNINFDGSYPISTNQWTHVAATYDGTVTKLYVNGICRDSTLAITGPMVPNTDSLYIGCDRNLPSTLDYFFDGMMNNIRIWNTARTERQIKENMFIPLYLQNPSGNYKGLVASYMFTRTLYSEIAGARDYSGLLLSNAYTRNVLLKNLSDLPLKQFDYNNWLSLDGNSYCVAENFEDFNATTAITVEAWIKCDSLISIMEISPRPLVSKTSLGWSWDYSLFMGGGGSVFFSINSSSLTQVAKEYIINDKYWHHIAGTYDSVDGQMILYIDGNIVSQDTLVDKPLIDNHPDSLYIGAMSIAPILPNKFIGCIDEVRIWKNVARTQDQIRNSMYTTLTEASGAALNCTFGFNGYVNYLTTNINSINPILQFMGNAKIGSSHLQNSLTPPILFSYSFNDRYDQHFFVSTNKTKLIAGGSAFDTLKVTKTGYVTDLKIFTLLNHESVGSVGISLVSPSGQSVDLLPPKNPALTDHDLITLFDPEADSTIDFTNPGMAPFSAIVKPIGEFSIFNNSPAAGLWKLKISDASTGDITRVLNGWGLNITTTPVDVKENDMKLSYLLEQNFPNPFNPSTTIKYSIPKANRVVVKLFDALGREVATLVNEEETAGQYEINYDATKLSSGIYFYQLHAGDYLATKKMMLIK
jgi:subtilisin-like proprotein convertase family protein